MGANKNSIKIIGEKTPNYAQGYFVYDSKKAGSVTVSHLRFGPDPIRSTYLISQASFVGCHQFQFLDRVDVLAAADHGATFLLNAPFGPDEIWDHLPRKVQRQILDKQMRFFVIDGYKVAREAGMGGRINTIMQTCFFAVSGVLPRDEAIAAIKTAIRGHVWQARRSGRAEEFRRGGHVARPPPRSRRAATGEQHFRRAASGAGASPRLSFATFSARSSPATAIRFPSAPCLRTAPFPPARRNGKSAISPSRFRSGTSRCAFSAASACWFARTR